MWLPVAVVGILKTIDNDIPVLLEAYTTLKSDGHAYLLIENHDYTTVQRLKKLTMANRMVRQLYQMLGCGKSKINSSELIYFSLLKETIPTYEGSLARTWGYKQRS